MFSLDIKNLCRIVGGTANFEINSQKIKGVEIDSRRIKDNMLFVPLIGERADGHSFFDKYMKERGIISLWNLNHEKPNSDLPVIYVEDTLKAMQELAKYYIEHINPIVVGITGSNGKTSVKDILKSILSLKYKVYATEGNLNSDIGLPLTILRMEKDTEVCVLEMGIDHFGDMALSSNIANPDIAILTNIGEAHLDDLLTREGIAKAKLEFIPNLKRNSVIIYNGDEPLIENELNKHEVYSKKLSFGLKADNTYIPELVEVLDTLKFILTKPPVPSLEINTIGIHQMFNATAAIACAFELDVSEDEIREGLKNVSFGHMRTEIEKYGEITFLNDTYKSNPSALRAGLQTLYKQNGYTSKIVIIGDMLGIGENCVAYHKEIGEELDPSEIDYVFTCGGEYSHNISDIASKKFGDKAKHFENKDELVKYLRNLDLNGSMIFLKASRSMEFEQIISLYKKEDI